MVLFVPSFKLIFVIMQPVDVYDIREHEFIHNK